MYTIRMAVENRKKVELNGKYQLMVCADWAKEKHRNSIRR